MVNASVVADRVEVVSRVPDTISSGIVLPITKTLGHQSASVHNFLIRTHAYKSTKFVIGIGTENILEGGFTGLNTRAGDLLTVKFRFPKPAAGGVVDPCRVPMLMHIVSHSDHFLEIHDTGVRVFDYVFC